MSTTTHHIAYSLPNRAWIVWRQDGDRQIGVRVHTSKASAHDDYQTRVDFHAQVTQGETHVR